MPTYVGKLDRCIFLNRGSVLCFFSSRGAPVSKLKLHLALHPILHITFLTSALGMGDIIGLPCDEAGLGQVITIKACRDEFVTCPRVSIAMRTWSSGFIQEILKGWEIQWWADIMSSVRHMKEVMRIF